MVELKATDETDETGRYRAWLSSDELDALFETVSDDMQKEIAFRLMAEAGLRSAEVLDVTMDHVRKMETDSERYKLVVPDGKNGKRRETIISPKLHTKMQAYSQANATGSAPLVDRTTRTLQNWMKDATGAQNGDDWDHVSCHDLRRSWAKGLLEKDASVPAVMQLGGWQDYETFRDHYLGTLSDDSIAEQTATFVG